MANRNWANGGKIMSMNVGPVINNVDITIGSTGAVSSFLSTIVKSVVRTGTGLYTINLQDNYKVNLFSSASMQSPVSGLSGIMAIEIQNAPNASVSSLSAPSISIKTLDVSGALADPASGSIISLLMFFNNSSVKA